ncbi:MAG: RNA methyltransferase [Lachnospiraceae bacterium]|nr:RNA methyltransferase [Lachnospiraceae bacterium]
MITSRSNGRIKDIISLMSSARSRRESGLYVAEGEKIFTEAPVDQIDSVFISETYPDKCSEEARIKLEKTGYELTASHVFNKITDTKTPQGILVVLRQPSYDLNKIISSLDNRVRVLLLEGVQDPGNLGTMIRTAEGAGFDLIIADRRTADVYNPKVIRSTMGSVFRVNICYTEDLKESIKMLKNTGTVIYAAHLKGERDYCEEEYGDKAAFIIGNEGNGLSDEITALADKLIRIPMCGKVESLNASVAAAILMYNSIR